MGLFYCKGLINMTKPILGGKPLIYETPEKLQAAVDRYFIYCQGEKALDNEGNPIITKYGFLYSRDPIPPTVEGMCVYIGFNAKQTWYNYAEREEYIDVVTRARLKFEQYNTESLYDRDRFKGAERTLVHHYGWEPANQIQITNNTLNLSMSDEEKDLRMQKIVKRLSESGQLGLLAEKLEAEQK